MYIYMVLQLVFCIRLFFQTVDEEFNREEKKFVNLEKAVRSLVRNVSTYLEQLQVKCLFNVIFLLTWAQNVHNSKLLADIRSELPCHTPI